MILASSTFRKSLMNVVYIKEKYLSLIIDTSDHSKLAMRELISYIYRLISQSSNSSVMTDYVQFYRSLILHGTPMTHVHDLINHKVMEKLKSSFIYIT